MRHGLDAIAKQIDVLTYNARSCINALIRSVLTTSANGFHITREGVRVGLTNVEIYRVYHFYQSWEGKLFDPDAFDLLIEEQDKTPVLDAQGQPEDASTAKALVSHSKLLFLNAVNMDNTDNEFWLGLLRTNENPKLISNSAPIPINLRTPIFDANLSTQTYNQEDTYLMPFGYYGMSIRTMGYSGDNSDHYLAGLSWDIAHDPLGWLNLAGGHVAVGGINADDTRKTKELQTGDLAVPSYAFKWGMGGNARALYSTAGGFNSVVTPGAVAGVAIGYGLQATATRGAAIGGMLNSAVSDDSGVFAGTGNYAAGLNSMIGAGTGNSTGGVTYRFSFPEVNIACEDCTYTDPQTGQNMPIVEGAEITAYNVIVVDGNASLWIPQGSTVAVHSLTRYQGNRNVMLEVSETSGDAFDTQTFTVTGVSYNPSANTTTITLNAPIAGNSINGGRITCVFSGSPLGQNSFATGFGTVAMGEAQTAVGQFNYPLYDARFVVGTGLSGADRRNAIEVHNSPDVGTYLYGDFNYVAANAYVLQTIRKSGIYLRNYINRLDMLIGGIALSAIGNDTGLFLNGLSEGVIGAVLQSASKAIVLQTGHANFANNPLYTDGVGQYDIRLGSAARMRLMSQGNMYISSTSDSIIMNASQYITIGWGGNLFLNGNTFKALPTNDKSYSHTNYAISAFSEDRSSNINMIGRTGFYAISADTTNRSALASYTQWNGNFVGAMSIIASTPTQGGTYRWSLDMPYGLSAHTAANMPNIAVHYTNDGQGVSANQLAYLRDVNTAVNTLDIKLTNYINAVDVRLMNYINIISSGVSFRLNQYIARLYKVYFVTTTINTNTKTSSKYGRHIVLRTATDVRADSIYCDILINNPSSAQGGFKIALNGLGDIPLDRGNTNGIIGLEFDAPIIPITMQSATLAYTSNERKINMQDTSNYVITGGNIFGTFSVTSRTGSASGIGTHTHALSGTASNLGLNVQMDKESADYYYPMKTTQQLVFAGLLHTNSSGKVFVSFEQPCTFARDAIDQNRIVFTGLL